MHSAETLAVLLGTSLRDVSHKSWGVQLQVLLRELYNIQILHSLVAAVWKTECVGDYGDKTNMLMLRC